MVLKELELRTFRNYKDRKYDFDGLHTVLVGPNGSGKTNLLEAIYYLSRGRSFRAAADKDLVTSGSGTFGLTGTFRRETAARTVEIGYRVDNGTKKARMNGKAVSFRRISGDIRVDILYVNDLNMVQGPAGYRRRYMNEILVLSDPEYAGNLEKYVRTLRQKKALLKKKNIPHWTSLMSSWPDMEQS